MDENSEKTVALRSEWVIQNANAEKNKKFTQSNRFLYLDFQWFLAFYFEGDEFSKDQSAVFLFIEGNSVPKGKFAVLDFSLKVINKNPANTITRGSFFSFFLTK